MPSGHHKRPYSNFKYRRAAMISLWILTDDGKEHLVSKKERRAWDTRYMLRIITMWDKEFGIKKEGSNYFIKIRHEQQKPSID